ncbi:MAG: DUF4336 domain-containing protein [Polyangiaceae bacterium]|nr:DUF4336 domain-containing protein [Polyangiaceae bacterium]
MPQAQASETWVVHPHDPIEKLESNLWRVEGSLPNMPLRRVMTVARLASGGLVVYNAIALEEAAMQEVDAWGKVEYIIVPNAWHKLDAKRFAERYPNAKVIAPASGREKVVAVVARAAGPEQLPENADIVIQEFGGTRERELYMTVRSGSGISLIVADALFNMPHLTGVQGFLLRHITRSSGGPVVSRVSRAILVKDKKAYAEQLRSLATPDLRRVIVAHHQVISESPAETLRQVASTVG